MDTQPITTEEQKWKDAYFKLLREVADERKALADTVRLYASQNETPADCIKRLSAELTRLRADYEITCSAYHALRENEQDWNAQDDYRRLRDENQALRDRLKAVGEHLQAALSEVGRYLDV